MRTSYLTASVLCIVLFPPSVSLQAAMFGGHWHQVTVVHRYLLFCTRIKGLYWGVSHTQTCKQRYGGSPLGGTVTPPGVKISFYQRLRFSLVLTASVFDPLTSTTYQ